MKRKQLFKKIFLSGLVLGLLLLSWTAPLPAQEENTLGSFTFVQLCDTQLGMGGYEHDVASFSQAVKQINFLQPAFVVICGDLVEEAKEQSFHDFKRIRGGLHVPCYSVPGNHDIGVKPDAASLSRYRSTLGKDYDSFEYKDYLFLLVNTQLWKSPIPGETERQDFWLKQKLLETYKEGKPVFVVGHYPLFLKEPDEKEEYFNLPHPKRKELLQWYQQHGVVAVLAGHTHKTIINEYEGIQFVNGETTSKNFDKRPLGFRLWKISPTSITHEFVPLEEFKIE